MDVHQVVCLFSCLFSVVYSSFKDVSNSVGFRDINGRTLAAFGDFDADKKTDLFFIYNGKDESKVEVYLWDSDDDEFRQASKTTITLSYVFITNVMPGDFNSDGHLDVVISYINSSQTFVKLYKGKQLGFDRPVDGLGALIDQPAIIDFDGDLRPDLLANKAGSGERTWWKYHSENDSFSSEVIVTSPETKFLSKPHSCAFLVWNDDYTPDFVITAENSSSNEVQYEIWLNKDGILTIHNQLGYSQPAGLFRIGQSTFVDIDSDGLTDHILPVCVDKDCSKSEIRVYSRSNNKWECILSSEQTEDYKWRFVKNFNPANIPLMTLRIGDYDVDGFPDAVMIVEIKPDNNVDSYVRKVVLLDNVKCDGSTLCYNGRKFRMVISNSALSSIENPIIATFFDLYENGVLDIMVVSANDSTHHYDIHAIKNSVYSDTCFLKVLVLGGSCYSHCPSGVKPYGVNQPGPFVKYITTGLHGDEKQASAIQLSQASYFALQPPYTVFGLGRTPNFVEELIVGLPQGSSERRVRTWPSIIPNSQVIIIPYPPDDPHAWTSMLLVTPSKLVLMTGGALLATCVFIGALVGVLHWQEKKEDRREKQEAAHKFHFDAM